MSATPAGKRSAPNKLEALRQRLTAAGVAFKEGGAELAEARAVLEIIQFNDCDGNLLEAYYGATVLNRDPFRSPLGSIKFITGQQGLGHIVLATKDYPGQVKFYHETLGFAISDYNDLIIPGRPPAHITFLHVNPRHHSIALGNLQLPRRFNHLMLEVDNLDDVGFALSAPKRPAPIS